LRPAYDLRYLGVTPGAYAITKLGGELIDTANDRRDAMRRGCAAAGETGARVWIAVEDSPATFHEVVCP
jgi:hypothetical protein